MAYQRTISHIERQLFGGYSFFTGLLWRFELPIECKLRSSLSSSELLAAMITSWIDVLAN
jgi:hypothetical protein